MKRILIVKLTSLGDMVFAQPLVADLQRAFPGVEIDWVADASCADIPSANPRIRKVIAPPLRSFKKSRRWADLKRIAAAIFELRRERYDVVLDMHGVYKSAIVSFLARARRKFGNPTSMLGESGAAFAYTDRFPLLQGYSSRHGHRVAVSTALGFRLQGEPQYDIHFEAAGGADAASAAPLAMIFHATSGEEKKWAPENWAAVGCELTRRGYRVALPWGSPRERQEAEAIAAGIPGAEVLPPMTVAQCAQQVASAALVLGTDTGFVHLADAIGKPAIMIFAATSPLLYSIGTPNRSASLGEQGRPPHVDEVLAALDAVCPLANGAANAAAPRALTRMT